MGSLTMRWPSRRGRYAPLALLAVSSVVSPASAEIVRVEILSRQIANGGQTVGSVGAFEIIRGRVRGAIDPGDRRNSIIQDIGLAPRNERGQVEYTATFELAKPVDMSKASRVLLYEVVNRGQGQVTIGPEGHVSLISGWQGDLVPLPDNHVAIVPIARQRDGTPVTGPVLARFVDVPVGTRSAPIRLSSMGSTPQQYLPVDLAQPKATLTMHASESRSGVHTGTEQVPRQDWSFGVCDAVPFPGTSDPAHLCLKNGFRADRVYELVYTARDPLVLGVGLAATRDIGSFFRYAKADGAGTPNPVAGAIDRVVSIGDSQSGNFIKTFIHLGFNQDESNRIVWDGAFPRLAARQTPINFRFALPGGAATLYEPGSEGVLWWVLYEDRVRGLPLSSLLARCAATRTCPKIFEAFGSAELWGLRMSPGLIGTDALADLGLPNFVRRYYYPGTTHGGGRGGFQLEPVATPGDRCLLPENPNPQADTTRALTHALVDWVVRGTPPPDSRYPQLGVGELVPATRVAIGLPEIPGVPFSDHILNPMLHYGFGPAFRPLDSSGTIAAMPPPIVRIIPTYVPRVNADGNETSGVPSVLHQAPLGTYLGWNVTKTGLYLGQGCGFTGGYVPFPRTRAEREAAGDPRPSVAERYGTLEGYVCVVTRAANQAVRDRFLLPDAAQRLVNEAAVSRVLPPDAESTEENRVNGRKLCP